jgi:hypothetical protein
MKRSVVAVGVVLALLGGISAAGADPRDSVDRGDRLDRDALRDDVRIDRLRVPQTPLGSQPPAQAAPFGDDSAVRKRTSNGPRLVQRRRGQTRAMPAGPSNRQMQLRQEEKLR